MFKNTLMERELFDGPCLHSAYICTYVHACKYTHIQNNPIRACYAYIRTYMYIHAC